MLHDFYFFLRRRESVINYSVLQSRRAKKYEDLTLARRANQRLHVVQVALQCPPARCRQPVFRFGEPSVKRLRTYNVIRFFELACMHAQIAVRGLQKGLELIEGKRA